MPRAGLDVAAGPRRALGGATAAILGDAAGAFPKVVTGPTLSGPVVIEHIFFETTDAFGNNNRWTPLVFPYSLGYLAAVDAELFKRSGLPLLSITEGGASTSSMRTMLGENRKWFWWIRKVIPWATWSLGFVFEQVGVFATTPYILRASYTRLAPAAIWGGLRAR